MGRRECVGIARADRNLELPEVAMTITIPDDILKQAGLTEREALIELACRLYDANRLRMTAASRLAGLERVAFEIELRARGIAVWRPTNEEFAADATEIRRLRQGA